MLSIFANAIIAIGLRQRKIQARGYCTKKP